MHKRKSGKTLSRNTNERKQLYRNLIRELVIRGVVTTTISKAKAVQPNLEKLITIAKKNSLNEFRKLVTKTGNVQVARKLVNYGKLFNSRKGGYTRITRMHSRQGDATQTVKFAWTEKLPEVQVPNPNTTEVSTKTSLPAIKTDKAFKHLVKNQVGSSK